jgi:hypothetical protein
VENDAGRTFLRLPFIPCLELKDSIRLLPKGPVHEDTDPFPENELLSLSIKGLVEHLILIRDIVGLLSFRGRVPNSISISMLNLLSHSLRAGEPSSVPIVFGSVEVLH